MENKKVIKELKKLGKSIKHLNKAIGFLISQLGLYDPEESENTTFEPLEVKENKITLAHIRERYIG